ncbi:MAG: hypothetical protein HZC02_04355 [Candidatus Levybacteria bacterium]|nr:hypothetical protein [Candidatus Levybacteria bacterium]
MKKILWPIIILCIGVVTIFPLFHSEYFPMHDNTQVSRVSQMALSLSEGAFPVRWVNDLGYGYGYPIFNFYAPFAYYVGAFFVLFGINSLMATKIMFGIGMISAGLSMYFLSKSFFGKNAAILSSLLYLFFPYHASLLYVRGAIGELFAYGFLPLPFLGLWQLYKTGKFRYVILFALGYGGIIISHNLSALMITPFIVLACVLLSAILYKKKQIRVILMIFSGLVLSILLSSWYVVPAIFEMKFTNISSILGGGSNPLDHFVCLKQFWSGPWGFAGSTKGCMDGMSFVIGKVHVLVLVIGLLTFAYSHRLKDKEKKGLLFFSFFLILLSGFLMTDMSSFIWKEISFLHYIQFPWRYLSFIALGVAVIGGSIVFFLERYHKRSAFFFIFLFVFLTVFYNKHYFMPQYFWSNDKAVSYFSDTKWTVSKISDEYLPRDFIKPKNRDEIPKELVKNQQILKNFEIIANSVYKKEFIIDLDRQTIIQINTAYFPGWQLSIDDRRDVKGFQKNGIFVLPLSEGVHHIELNFKQTPLERYSNYLSLLGIIIVLAGILHSRKEKYL